MATLQELVNETTNIKDELKTCHSNLSTALTEKGVNVTSEDKISSLIDKIENISISRNIVASNTVRFSVADGITYGISSETSAVLLSCPISNNGTLSLSANFTSSASYTYRLIVTITHFRNNQQIGLETITCYKDLNSNYDFNKEYNVEIGDVLIISANLGKTASAGGTVKGIKICYDYV